MIDDFRAVALVLSNADIRLPENREAIAALARIESDLAAANLRADTAERELAEARERLRVEANMPSPSWEASATVKHDTATCKECIRWKEMRHPIQHSCDEWYREFHRYEDQHKDATTRWAHRRSLAEELLDALAASPPAPLSTPAVDVAEAGVVKEIDGNLIGVDLTGQPGPCRIWFEEWPGAHIGQRVEVIVRALLPPQVPAAAKDKGGTDG